MIAAILILALLDPVSAPHAGEHAQKPVERVRDEQIILSSVAVTLECTARQSGKVENCQVLGETHPGLGFGDAAIVLMQDTHVAPGSEDIQFARTIQFTP